MTMKDITPVTGVANNKLTKEMTSVTLESGSVLTADTVRNYLVSGGGNVTDQEVVMFLELCKAQKLNPFVKDAYLIKYGNQAAQIVTGKDVFIKRAYENPNFDGMKAGVVILKRDGSLEYREGSLKLPNETLVGGWCEVYLKDKRCPAKAVVSFDEYAGRKANGQLNSMWANKGATMIRKVAQSQALRDGSLEYREGSLKLPNETLVGGWCEVYLKDKRCPAKAVVSFDEYAGRQANGQLNSMWANKGATMIRKVAQSQALRDAFPSEFKMEA